MKFAITDPGDLKELADWKAEQISKATQAQKGTKLEKYHDISAPYTGAIGGMFSYIFTPTSIGTFIKVECSLTGESISLDSDFR